MQEKGFKTEVKVFSYLFCALITLCCLPILAYHYYTTLDGFALLAIGGLLLTDCVMWFASHWSTRTGHAVMRAVSLAVKFGIAAIMVSVAAIAIMLMRADRQTAEITKLSSQNRTAEIASRAEAVKSLAGINGTREAMRELAKVSATESVTQTATNQRAALEAKIPAWLLDQGLYSLPPLSAIAGALLLSICALVLNSGEESDQVAETDLTEYARPHESVADRALTRTWTGSNSNRPH
jgi:hypothetical protein